MNKKKIPKIPFILAAIAFVFIILSFAIVKMTLPPSEEVIIYNAFSSGGLVNSLSGGYVTNDVIAGGLSGIFALPYSIDQDTENDFLTWYMAEGCTRGFDTWILIQNPGDNEAQVKVTFMDQYGNTVEVTTETDPELTTLEAHSRSTIYVNDFMPDKDVSTTVESINGEQVIVERAMYWNRRGIEWIGGHNSIAVTSPATTWYLAEGCTRGFDSWILIQNPGANEARVKVTFMDQFGETVEVTPDVDPENTVLEAHSRGTIYVNNHMPGRDVSTKVESTNGEPIIVERAMYWSSQAALAGGG